MYLNRSGGWESLEESTSNHPDEEQQQRRGPNPLLKPHFGHVCLPVIDTQIMLVDSIKARASPGLHCADRISPTRTACQQMSCKR